MSGESINAAVSFTRLRPAARPVDLPSRPDDPRLGQVVGFEPAGAIRSGTPVLVGFPQDEGVRRNGGRVGAAAAPAEIRRYLYRTTTFDGSRGLDLGDLGLLDLGDLEVSQDLEADQVALAGVISDLLRAGAVPIVLGGGHETAFGVYLGHVLAGQEVSIINLDAHLDVRPTIGGLGHSGSPFRQAMEHAAAPLPGAHYSCLGAQPFAVSRAHLDFVRSRGGVIVWRDEIEGTLCECVKTVAARHSKAAIHLSIDADVVCAADVPGVSAPNPAGLPGVEVAECAAQAGADPRVASLELVEINPRFDLDGRSSRWAAFVVWKFLGGLAARRAAISA